MKGLSILLCVLLLLCSVTGSPNTDSATTALENQINAQTKKLNAELQVFRSVTIMKLQGIRDNPATMGNAAEVEELEKFLVTLRKTLKTRDMPFNWKLGREALLTLQLGETTENLLKQFS